MMDDAELLRAYAENRSETAFAGFVERRVGFVHATALRMVAGNAHTAQDVTQAVFVLVANKAAALARHERITGWLHTTTRNVSRQTMRAASRRDAREQEAARMSEIENYGGIESDGGDRCGVARRSDAGLSEIENDGRDCNSDAGLETHAPDRVPDADRLRPMLDEALGALREREREAVLLRYFEGRGFAEIGGALRMSEDAARKRVVRAVEKMRAAFARRGVTSSAAALGALMSAEAAQAAPAGLAASVSAGAMAAAGAVAAVATGAGVFLAFMSSTKITMAAAVALLIAAGGIYYGVQNERASAAALALARRENVKLAAQLREVEKQNAAATVRAPAPARDPVAAGDALLAAHPEIIEKLAALETATGARLSYRFAQALDLSPEQSERLAKYYGRNAGRDSLYATRNHGMVAFKRESRWDDSESLQAMLGDADYGRLLYLLSLNNAGAKFSRELGNALYFTDEPLTSRLAWSLDEIARDIAKENDGIGITDEEARWSAIVGRAKSVLTPGQMRALVAIGDRHVWRNEHAKWLDEHKATTQSK